jgi:bidirectional [NiFe] hydrogenase diaphorase subunit
VDACPTGSIFHKGMTTAEEHKDSEKLEFLAAARDRQQWTR